MQIGTAVDDDLVATLIKAFGDILMRPGVTGAGDIDRDALPVYHVDGSFGLGVLRPDVVAHHGQKDDHHRRDDRPDDLQQRIAVVGGSIAIIAGARAKGDDRDQQHALDQEEDHAADDHQDVEEFINALGFSRGLLGQHTGTKVVNQLMPMTLTSKKTAVTTTAAGLIDGILERVSFPYGPTTWFPTAASALGIPGRSTLA